MLKTNRIFRREKIGIFLALVLSSLVIYSAFAFDWKAQAAGTYAGVVYVDYNMNGARNTTATAPNYAVDKGAGGVIVTLYDAGGTARGTATTCSALNTPTSFCTGSNNGAYSIAATGTGPYRVEFTNLPTGAYPSFTGTNNATTVRFVADGGASNIDLGIIEPIEYCENVPFLVTNSYAVGSGSFDTLVRYPYNYSDELDGRLNSVDATNWTDPPSRTSLLSPTGIATVDPVGATFGLSWNNLTDRLYASAYLKRGARFGTLSSESTGAIYLISNPASDSPSSSVYVNLNTVFGANTAGANPHPAASTPDWTVDTNTIPLIGKVGLGSLKLSEDGSTLYTVNLNDRRLYVIPTTGTLNSTTITRYDIPTSGLATSSGNCATADVRPFGLGRDRSGQIYVGAVCSAESTANDNQLHAYVWRFSSGSFTLVANQALNFARTASSGETANWNYWANTGGVLNRAAPMLTDIEFDGADMILAFRDRYGDQVVLPDYYRGYGDLMRACSNGSGGFNFENNGSCGGVTAGGAGVSEGPGGGEYYADLNGDGREEGGLGGLVQVPGFNHVLTTHYDPVTYNSFGTRVNNYFTAGVQRYNNRTGLMLGAYDVYLDAEPGNFGKADGSGDSEVLCEKAPLQIGNRVWSDTDGDGVQDAGENGIQNVTVQLYSGGSAVTTTASYRDEFNAVSYSGTNGSVNWSGSPWQEFGDDNVITTGDVVVIADGADNALRIDRSNRGVSRAVTLSGYSSASLNFSYRRAAGFMLVQYSTDGTTWNDVTPGATSGWETAGTDGSNQTAANISIPTGATFIRFNSQGANSEFVYVDNVQITGVQAVTSVTDANGQYLFSGSYMQPNTAYEIRIATGQAALAAVPNLTTMNASGDSNADIRDSDASLSRANAVIAYTTGGAGNNNHTLDAGFTALSLYSLGNRVWMDTNNDGQINVTEVGVSTSVSVSVFIDVNADGQPDNINSPVATVTTDNLGYYRFDGLAAGNYVVRVNPASFVNTGGYRNSQITDATDKDSTSVAGQNGENGINPAAANSQLTNGILSGTIVLGASAEPTAEADVQVAGQGAVDNRANMTVDFGFYKLNLSGTVWRDNGAGANNNNGILDSDEVSLSGYRVQLYDSSNVEIPVGADGILGTSDDGANGMLTTSGNYNFQGLPAGTYRVVVTPGGTTSSTPTSTTPDDNINNNDDGTPQTSGVFNTKVTSGLVTLTPGNAGALGNNTINNTNGSTSNPTVDFGFILAPTAVRLEGFEAFTDGASVELKWSTGEESGNLGFNVYRELNGERQLLNPALIAGNALRSSAALAASGDDYSWTDKEFAPGAVYYLEDLDVNGGKALHGAVVPTFKSSLENKQNARLLSDLTQVINPSSEREIVDGQTVVDNKDVKSLLNNQRRIAALGGVKISVNHDGWYRVSAEQLQAAGFDTNSNRAFWQLFADGAEVPIKLNADDSIEFFGRGLDTPLTDRQVYYLVNGQSAGLRVNEIDGGQAGEVADAQSFNVTVERKDRFVYSSIILNGEEDNWFGAVVNQSNETVQNLTVRNLDANGQAHLQIKLQGATMTDHSVSIRFNDVELGTVRYGGFENQTFDFDLPASALREGANQIRLQSTENSDVSLVDAIRLSYRRGYTANDNRLRFSVPAGQTVRVGGFSEREISVFEIQNGAARRQVRGSDEETNGTFGFSLSASNENREFVAVINSTVEQAAIVERNAPSSWNNSTNKADFVIITSNDLREQAGNLAAMREAQDLKTQVVLVDDLFDEFTFGKRDPQAVKEFLKLAAGDWKLKPRYALLFGDASYDSRNRLGLSVTRDIVPTKMVDTQYLETSSDSWLADSGDDGIEDLALGRLPVGNPAEAAAAVEKLARYAVQNLRPRKSAVLIADRGFENYSADLQSLLPNRVNAFRIDRSLLTDAETHQNIVERLNASPSVVTYTGHGSTTVWGNSSVFRASDAANLTNERLSVYLLMTCLNGYTAQPNSDSLAEALIKAERGAIAVWTSSGITHSERQFEISQAFTRLVFNQAGKSSRIGDVVKSAKQSTTDSDVRRTWQLVGDPTVFVR